MYSSKDIHEQAAQSHVFGASPIRRDTCAASDLSSSNVMPSHNAANVLVSCLRLISYHASHMRSRYYIQHRSKGHSKGKSCFYITYRMLVSLRTSAGRTTKRCETVLTYPVGGCSSTAASASICPPARLGCCSAIARSSAEDSSSGRQ